MNNEDGLAELLPPLPDRSAPVPRMPGLLAAPTPMEMVSRALAQNASIEVLTKLMDLQERWEQREARRAFDTAVAAAKAEIPVIIKNSTGHNSKKYADFSAYAKVVDPIISAHGLHYRFRTKQDDKIHVTCILGHSDGYSEENTLSGPPDKTGSKNDIQAIGSTLSYLQRYTLIQALGLAASEDDDGRGSGKNDEPITDEQRASLQTLIDETSANIEAFCGFFKIDSMASLPAAKYDEAVKILERKRKAAR